MISVRSTDQTDDLSQTEQHLITAFHPKFVYPIFGQEETIYGYQDLDLQVRDEEWIVHELLMKDAWIDAWIEKLTRLSLDHF